MVLLKEVAGDEAEALSAELPGLVMVQGSGGDRKAVVTDARQHEKLLEKVGARAAVPVPMAELEEGICKAERHIPLTLKAWLLMRELLKHSWLEKP